MLELDRSEGYPTVAALSPSFDGGDLLLAEFTLDDLGARHFGLLASAVATFEFVGWFAEWHWFSSTRVKYQSNSGKALQSSTRLEA